MVKGLKAIMILMLITAAFNLFLTPGEELVSFWRLTITKEGLTNAVLMAIRLTYLILGTSVMTLTTTPNQLTDAIESLLKSLEALRVPVHDFAMMMSLALRFIPILLDEANRIINAQSARGADFEEGNLWKRMKAMVSILVPLLVSSVRRAYDLAMAMESRCYHGGTGRTKMKPLKYRSVDYVVYGFLVLYFVLVIAVTSYIRI